jgi:hypothetical protein
MIDEFDDLLYPQPLNDNKEDPAFHLICRDTYDEKTFVLELRIEDIDRRRLATRTMHLLQRLERRRAANDEAANDETWTDLIDIDRLRAELHGSDERRSTLANRIMDNLVDLADLRRSQSPYNMWARAPKGTTKGGRRAV